MGEWVERSVPWHDTRVMHCQCCGRIIPRRIWQVEIEGATYRLCSLDCEDLFRSYWLPTYGGSGRGGAGASPGGAAQR